MRDWKKFVVI